MPATPPKPSARPVTFDAGAPRELADLYHRHYQGHLDAGKGHAEAHRRAIRLTQHAGWYKTAKGWRRLTPDLRGKVNLSEAVRQPDGRYVIEGVPVFYPNAVKAGLAFSAGDVRQIIDNTNRSIRSGSQKPGILEGHPGELQKAIGIQLDSHGSAVNWREHPQRPGHAVCDLVDVEEPYVHRLQARRLTGLSAGFAKDTHGLNRRFGHVALLGGTTQALSQLPATEVFSVSGNYVCFSADTDFFPKGTAMNFSDKQWACFASLHSAHEAYEAAEASANLGEPDADSKLGEAHKGLTEAFAAAQSEMAPAGPAAAAPEFEGLPVAQTEQTQNPAPAVAAGGEPEFAADPEGAFAAVSGRVDTLTTNVQKLLEANARLQSQNHVLLGRQAKTQFEAEVDKLRKEGRTLPAKFVDQQFKLCFESKDPKRSLTDLLASLKEMPAAQTPAGAGQMFDATANRPAGPGKPLTKEQLKANARNYLGRAANVSEEDLAYAALGEVLGGE